MFLRALVFIAASQVTAQEQGITTVPPVNSPPIPFLDLFTGASNYYPERKVYSEPSHYHVSCPKSDFLSSFASILSSAAKILFSAAVILILKFLAGKLLLFPLTVILLGKIGIKIALLWPMISKIVKYFKKKKKKSGLKMRAITDCSQRIACVIQRVSQEGWPSNVGAALTFSLVDDIDEDSSVAKAMLSVFSSEKVAQCMAMDCISGVDID